MLQLLEEVKSDYPLEKQEEKNLENTFKTNFADVEYLRKKWKETISWQRTTQNDVQRH